MKLLRIMSNLLLIGLFIFSSTNSMAMGKSKKLSKSEVKEKVTAQQTIEESKKSNVVSSSVSTGETSCAQILITKCTQCHTSTRFCQKLGEKSKSSWKRTLKRMAKKKDSTITTDDMKILLPCIVDQEEGIKEVCK